MRVGPTAVVGMAVAIALGVFAAVEMTGSPEARPDALYDEDALPPLPDRRDNGWFLLVAPPPTVDLSADTDQSIHVLAYEETPAESYEALREHDLVEARRSSLGQPRHALAIEQWTAAAQAPTVADACSRSDDDSCRYFAVYKLSRLAIVDAVSRGVDDDDWDEAIERQARSLRLIRRMLETNRTLMGAMVGLSAAKEHLPAAWMMLGHADGGESRAGLKAELTRWAESDVLSSSGVEHRALAGEYLRVQEAIEGSDDDTLGFLERLQYDEGHTEQLLADSIRFLRGERESLPTCGTFDAIRNDVGCGFMSGQFSADTRALIIALGEDRRIAADWLDKAEAVAD